MFQPIQRLAHSVQSHLPKLMKWSVMLLLLLTVGLANPVYAQGNGQIYTVNCRGYINGYGAILTGQERYSSPNALGNSYVTFQGILTIQGGRYPFHYEAWTNLAPYKGYIQVGQRQFLSIAVLPNSGGKFIIYEGRETLSAPNTLGELTCR